MLIDPLKYKMVLGCFWLTQSVIRLPDGQGRLCNIHLKLIWAATTSVGPKCKYRFQGKGGRKSHEFNLKLTWSLERVLNCGVIQSCFITLESRLSLYSISDRTMYSYAPCPQQWDNSALTPPVERLSCQNDSLLFPLPVPLLAYKYAITPY